MEKLLNQLFDYQRFGKNEKLDKLIRETEGRAAVRLSDDELGFVSAAGADNGDSSEWYGLDNPPGTFEPGSRLPKEINSRDHQ